jgi:hypothetical protein
VVVNSTCSTFDRAYKTAPLTSMAFVLCFDLAETHTPRPTSFLTTNIKVPKCKHGESATITYGASVPWLRSLIHKASTCASGNVYVNSVNHDPIFEGLSSIEAVKEASKVDCLLHHHLGNRFGILRFIGLAPGTDEYQNLDKQLSLKQPQWKIAF